MTMTEENKKEKIKNLTNKLVEKYGEGSVMVGNTGGIANVESFSSASLALDLALGVGGWPRGRIGEIYGPESAGKTTLALQAIASCQRDDGIAVFIDAEHAFDPEWARRIGVDMDSLIINQPDNGEDALAFAMDCMKTGDVDLIVIDSVPALVPKEELEGELGDHQIGAMARMMSKALRQMSAVASKYGTTILFLNQIREKIGVMFGSPETTPGGRALKFYCSLRVEVRKGGKIGESGNILKMPRAGTKIIGQVIKIKIVKNKVAPPFKVAQVHLMFDVDNNNFGFDPYSEIVDIAEECGIITKKGSHYSYGDVKLGQGKANATELIRSDDKLFEELEIKVSDAVLPKPGEFVTLVDEEELDTNIKEQLE